MSPNGHWKTADYKRLESQHAELLKTIDGHIADVKSQLAQKKAVSTVRAYQCFFKLYDELEENRQQQRLILKPKFVENFDNDTKRILLEMSKVLRFLRDIEHFRTQFVDCPRDTLQAYTLV